MPHGITYNPCPEGSEGVIIRPRSRADEGRPVAAGQKTARRAAGKTPAARRREDLGGVPPARSMLTANINVFISLSQITASIYNKFGPIHEFKNSQVAGWKLVFFVIHQEK